MSRSLTCWDRMARGGGERIDAAGRLGWLPVIEIAPGDAVVLPHCPVTAVHVTDTLVIATWRSLTQRVFDRAAWALVFRPDQPTASCTGCGRTWLEGCDPGCKRRLLFEEDLLTDFDADGLVLGEFNRSGVTWPPGHQGGPGNA